MPVSRSSLVVLSFGRCRDPRRRCRVEQEHALEVLTLFYNRLTLPRPAVTQLVQGTLEVPPRQKHPSSTGRNLWSFEVAQPVLSSVPVLQSHLQGSASHLRCPNRDIQAPETWQAVLGAIFSCQCRAWAHAPHATATRCLDILTEKGRPVLCICPRSLLQLPQPGHLLSAVSESGRDTH